jgi:hypothetical protein
MLWGNIYLTIFWCKEVGILRVAGMNGNRLYFDKKGALHFEILTVFLLLLFFTESA